MSLAGVVLGLAPSAHTVTHFPLLHLAFFYLAFLGTHWVKGSIVGPVGEAMKETRVFISTKPSGATASELALRPPRRHGWCADG